MKRKQGPPGQSRALSKEELTAFLGALPDSSTAHVLKLTVHLGVSASNIAGIGRKVKPGDLLDTFVVLALLQGTDPALVARHLRVPLRRVLKRYGRMNAAEIKLESPLDFLRRLGYLEGE